MGKEGIGDVYVDSIKLVRYRPARFATHSLTMRSVIIVSDSAAVVMGRQGKQVFPMAASEEYVLHNLDLADLYFRDDTATGTVYVIGTTRD